MVLALLVGSSACSSSGESVAEPSSSSSPAATIAEGKPCPPAPEELGLPQGSGCATSATGEFERRGHQATFVVYARVDGSGIPKEWRFRLDRPDDSSIDEPAPVGSRSSYPLILGSEDADGMGLDEAFVRAVTHSYHSGATFEVALFGVENGEFFRVQERGKRFAIPVGGVSVFGEGGECRDVDLDGDPELVLLRIDYVSEEVQRWSERIYEWSDRSLRLARRREGRFAKTGYNDPLVLRFYSLRCFGFEPRFPYSRG
jgi:hypothetical protein